MMSFMILPLVACLLLTGIHVYFGAFVLRRGVLFVDLALAQWAALGYLVAHWLGIESYGLLFLMGFGFTLIASLIITLLKPIFKELNYQEAVIGIMYISASAFSIGLISATGMEGHQLKNMMAGHLLFVQPFEVMTAALLYGAIGIGLYFAHSRFLSASSRLWDFVFYALFGLVVTSSVKIAGVLMVFSFLVLPLLSTVLFTSVLKKQLISAWIIGIFASMVGLWLSFFVDVPPSFCVILALCLIWVLSILAFLLKAKRGLNRVF